MKVPLQPIKINSPSEKRERKSPGSSSSDFAVAASSAAQSSSTLNPNRPTRKRQLEGALNSDCSPNSKRQRESPSPSSSDFAVAASSAASSSSTLHPLPEEGDVSIRERLADQTTQRDIVKILEFDPIPFRGFPWEMNKEQLKEVNRLFQRILIDYSTSEAIVGLLKSCPILWTTHELILRLYAVIDGAENIEVFEKFNQKDTYLSYSLTTIHTFRSALERDINPYSYLDQNHKKVLSALLLLVAKKLKINILFSENPTKEGPKLGQGSFGSVIEDQENKKAIKIIAIKEEKRKLAIQAWAEVLWEAAVWKFMFGLSTVDFKFNQKKAAIHMPLLEKGPDRFKHLEQFTFDVFKSLKKLHDRGIIHGDIKSNNIAFDGKEFVIIDFGQAKAPGPISFISEDIKLCGSPFCWSPTLWNNSGCLSVYDDVYAFCIVIYQILNKESTPFIFKLPKRSSPRNILTQDELKDLKGSVINQRFSQKAYLFFNTDEQTPFRRSLKFILKAVLCLNQKLSTEYILNALEGTNNIFSY